MNFTVARIRQSGSETELRGETRALPDHIIFTTHCDFRLTVMFRARKIRATMLCCNVISTFICPTLRDLRAFFPTRELALVITPLKGPQIFPLPGEKFFELVNSFIRETF